jgi:recombination protein RecA
LAARVKAGGNYFSGPKTSLKFIKSGCQLFDLALGGGWARGRMANIVGDKSTGKTLLAIEACANFARDIPEGDIYYREAEAAFDKPYAEAIGMPLDRVNFGEAPLDTVEDMFEELTGIAEQAKVPILYIVDSLDALTDREEVARDIDKGTYGAGKAKKLSELFRRLVRMLETKDITFMIVSQTRMKIGALPFQKQWTRTGGRAIDFYASQVVYLAQTKLLTREVSKIKRPVGIEVLAKLDKNKVALPFREASYNIMFGFGIDDLRASLEWLKAQGLLAQVGIHDKAIDIAAKRFKEKAFVDKVNAVVAQRWYEIESSFLPTERKYE